MKKLLTFLIIVIIFLTLSLPQTGQCQYNVIRVDFLLTLTDGTKLDCSRMYPDATIPTNKWPAIIYCHGYGGTKNDLIEDATDMASYGFYTFCYSMRGQGYSTGLSNLMSTTEMNDFIQVGNYVKADIRVNPNRVAAVGGSQGGTIPFMAACNGYALRCINSDVASPEFATSWIENNSVKMSLLWTVSYDTSIARYNNLIKSLRNWILTDTKEKWDSIAYHFPINRDFQNKVNQCTARMNIGTVWQDKFFSTNGMIKIVNTLPSPYLMYMGTFNAHGADNDETEGEYHDLISGEFLDYWINDVQNGIMDSAKFTYASSRFPRTNNMWTWQRFSSNTWPPSGVQDIKFYFRPNGKINNLINTSLPDTIGLLNDVKDTTLTMTESVNREFTGSIFDGKFGKKTLIFDSNPMVQDCRMVGIPKINLHYLSNADKVQFNLQIWCVATSGIANLVTRANYTVRNNVPNQIRQLTFDGMAYSHIFRTGEKIRIIITNLDNIPNDPFLRTNPHVLPSLKRARNIIYMNSANPSYIQLPLINYVISVKNISTSIPESDELEQNFPNPFNPKTSIRFKLQEQGKVRLSVFDMLGKNIKTLVNEQIGPGTYEINWDATGYPSGTYFYQIETSTGFKETRKMILLK